jgi:hypothetical protein
MTELNPGTQGSLTERYQAVLEHLESTLDMLAEEDFNSRHSDNLRAQLERADIVETWLENATGTLISWATEIGLDAGALEAVENSPTGRRIGKAFEMIESSCNDAVSSFR